jgi:hypothetical protein
VHAPRAIYRARTSGTGPVDDAFLARLDEVGASLRFDAAAG